ncbi:UBP1-associated protein 2C-like [Telopea speciosissima]|uniref:UBP1-associated protein 2C-like n=1 Tax=Telopea speciosissima TaxID=54955 RepID=UPI001CC4FD63|nr:UBP1-associated protein 2C-like [Telopea speciosissima]XP_043689466.1 UBP1-associated protein 2C-like [Telopea speciosissima]
MDSATKRRKTDENGDAASGMKLKPEDARKIIETFTQEQLLNILQDAAVLHLDVLDAVRAIADCDPTQRKLFIRGLGWDTASEGLLTLFSQYGDLEEAVVILDKVTGKSKGYGFVTFKHIDGAMLALKEPSKKIDGRMTVTQLAAAGNSGSTVNQPSAADLSMRRIYVGNVPQDMPADRLLVHFSSYGEIEEGPLGFDKQTGKSRGFALFVYKTAEAAKASLVDATKNIDGYPLICKLAIEGKRASAKPVQVAVGAGGVQAPIGGPGEIVGDGLGLPPPSSMPSTFTSQYGGPPAGLSSYGGFSGAHQGPPPFGGHLHHNLNSPLQSTIGASGLSSVGSQVPSSLGATGGYGAGLSGGPYGASQYAGPTSGGDGGLGGGGSSLYRWPASSVLPSGNYPESGHYGLTSSAYPSQHHPHTGISPAPRVPPGAMYQSMPPY